MRRGVGRKWRFSPGGSLPLDDLSVTSNRDGSFFIFLREVPPPRPVPTGDTLRRAPPRDLRGRTGLSEELGRAVSASEPEASELPVWLTTRREPRLRPASSVVTPPAPAPATDAKLGPSADQNNLANTGQRLEAVMRRPNTKEGTS